MIFYDNLDKTPRKKKKTTTSDNSNQVIEVPAPLVEDPAVNFPWQEVSSAFDELREAIDGLKIPVDNTDGDFIIEEVTEGKFLKMLGKSVRL